MIFQKLGGYSAHSCDPITWYPHSGEDQEVGPIGAWLIRWQADAHCHQPRLTHECKHHVQVRCWFRHTKHNDAHAHKWVRQRSLSIVPRWYGGKVQVSNGCRSKTHRHSQGLPIFHCWSTWACQVVGLLWLSKSEWCLFWLVQDIVHMGTCAL